MTTVTVNGLSKYYGPVRALDHLDLNLQGGRIIGLAGPNGSGKTTLLRILGSFDTAYDGQVLINGHSPGAKARAVVSYLPDRRVVSDWLTADQVIADYKGVFADFDENKAYELLDFFKLRGTDKLRQMSKGMQEKLQILLVMSRSAMVYLLDEPISGVDPASRKTILNGIIRQASENALILLSTHLIQDIEPIISEIIFLNQGRLVLHENTDKLCTERGQSLNEAFEEIFA